MKFRLICIALLMVLIAPAYVFSGSYSVNFIVEQVKKKKLPDYCMYMGVNHANKFAKGDQLRKKYGPDWNHMHHFCWALVDIQKGHDRQAIGNLNYVLHNIRKNSKLRPMVLRQKANILIINGWSSEAVPVYYELIEVQPYSEDGYIGLANIFLQSGDKKAALVIINQGLKNIPNSERFKRIIQ